jgi:hypothetical protein
VDSMAEDEVLMEMSPDLFVGTTAMVMDCTYISLTLDHAPANVRTIPFVRTAAAQ